MTQKEALEVAEKFKKDMLKKEKAKKKKNMLEKKKLKVVKK